MMIIAGSGGRHSGWTWMLVLLAGTELGRYLHAKSIGDKSQVAPLGELFTSTQCRQGADLGCTLKGGGCIP